MKRLTRSNEKIIAGVLSGISNYLNPELDPIFCRVIFLLITIYNPSFALIYLGLIFIMPTEARMVRNSRINI